ncbi:MAG TPA: gluconokinase [Vicinamibacterales bacterium]|nr:gluconokinase [Vicinamibacterales bacterium]
MIIVLMGVAGSGKTTVGRQLADTLGWPFHEGDTYHAAASVARMRRGAPLTEDDRRPWLASLHAVMQHHADRRESAVLACSALTADARTLLRGELRGVRVVYLKGSRDRLAPRLAARPGHFFPPVLLDSQLATLEEPDDALTLDIGEPVDAMVAAIRREFGV